MECGLPQARTHHHLRPAPPPPAWRVAGTFRWFTWFQFRHQPVAESDLSGTPPSFLTTRMVAPIRQTGGSISFLPTLRAITYEKMEHRLLVDAIQALETGYRIRPATSRDRVADWRPSPRGHQSAELHTRPLAARADRSRRAARTAPARSIPLPPRAVSGREGGMTTSIPAIGITSSQNSWRV